MVQKRKRKPLPSGSIPPSGDKGEQLSLGGDNLYFRVAIHFVPFLLVCYIVAMIDRLNVGFAKLQFMADLHFDEAVFGMAAGILYVGYILFEVPSNLILERKGLRLTLLRIMTLWGLFTMAMAFAANRWGFYGLRFLVGAAEAGFFPGIVYYLTLWFPNAWRARITSIFALGVPISGIVAGPVSGWIMTHMGGILGLRGWQWLFLIEGAPAVILGVTAYFYLPDRPADARFLSPREKAIIEREHASESAMAFGAGTFGQAMRQPRTLILALVYFAFFATQSVLLLWMPTLLRNAGVVGLAEIGWRTSLIFAAGAIGMAAAGWSSDRSRERRWHLIACGTVASLALCLLPLAAKSPAGTTLVLAIAAPAAFGFLALFWTLAALVFGKGARAGGIAFVSSIGAAGSALSPIFISYAQVLSGSLFGAIAVIALIFLASMGALYFCVPVVHRRSAAPVGVVGAMSQFDPR